MFEVRWFHLVGGIVATLVTGCALARGIQSKESHRKPKKINVVVGVWDVKGTREYRKSVEEGMLRGVVQPALDALGYEIGEAILAVNEVTGDNLAGTRDALLFSVSSEAGKKGGAMVTHVQLLYSALPEGKLLWGHDFSVRDDEPDYHPRLERELKIAFTLFDHYLTNR